MDPRLYPLNGLLALLRRDGAWPPTLHDQGFARSLVEAPITTSKGDIKADAMMYRFDPDLVVLCECKGGRTVDAAQAERYLLADAASLKRTGVIPAPLRSKEVAVTTLFVGAEGERAALEASLHRLGINAPLLTVGPDRARLSGASGIDGLDDFDVRHNHGDPPARFRVDHQSPPEEIAELLIQQIVAAQARRAEFLPTTSLCEAILPEWAILSQSGQRDFIRRAEELLRSLAKSQLARDVRFEPATSGVQSRLVILRTPASFDPRGATQGWQGLENRAARALHRTRATQVPGQMSLDDLADKGGVSGE